MQGRVYFHINNPMLKKLTVVVAIAVFVFLPFVGVLNVAHAQDLGDYTNLTVTSSIDLADDVVGYVFAQVRAAAPFVVQIGFAIAILVIVASLIAVIWYLATGWIHKLGQRK